MNFEAAPQGSPDFSPASVPFDLLTPTNLPPTTSFGIKQLQSPYELFTGLRSDSYITQTSLLFKPSSPTRLHHISDNGALSHSPTQPHSLPYYIKSYDHRSAAPAGVVPQPSYSVYLTSPSDKFSSQLLDSPQPPMSRRQGTANNVGISRGPISSSDLHVPQTSAQPTLDNFFAHADWTRSDEKAMVNSLGIGSGGVGIDEDSSGVVHHFHTNSRRHRRLKDSHLTNRSTSCRSFIRHLHNHATLLFRGSFQP
ncbi:hypothetical protein IW262DRAFT_1516414 [Armillaria fumosa]|nr:hypothetical protein IW262DRAFT_1516414 [Armillaria fumosa]